jgi:TatD DNase family protein
MIIDIHSHLNFPEFDNEREEIIKKMRSRNISTIVVGTSRKTSEECIMLAQAHPHIAATIGIHPLCEEVFRDRDFDDLITPNVVALGECGLDYYRGRQLETLQRANFEAQIAYASQHLLPLMIHARPERGTMNAYVDVVEMLDYTAHAWPQDVPRGDVHFFAGDITCARKFLEQGMTLSFDGPITYGHEFDEIIEFIPLDRLHVETDAPFAAPIPYRGQRSSPLMVDKVVERIAQVKKIPEAELIDILEQNAFRTFPRLIDALR